MMRAFSVILMVIAALLLVGCGEGEFQRKNVAVSSSKPTLTVPPPEFKYYKLSNNYYEVPNLGSDRQHDGDPIVNSGPIDIVSNHCCKGFSEYYSIDDNLLDFRLVLMNANHHAGVGGIRYSSVISKHNLQTLDNAFLRKHHSDFNNDFFLLREGGKRKVTRGLKGYYELLSKEGLYFGHKIYVQCASYCEGFVLYNSTNEVNVGQGFPPHMKFNVLFPGEKPEEQFYDELASVLSQIEILVEGFHVGTTKPSQWQADINRKGG